MASSEVAAIQAELETLGDAAIAEHSQRFFRTGPGEYGEGDQFIGIRVPVLRRLAKNYKHITLEEAEELLHSEWHERRLLALLILVLQYQKGDKKTRKAVFDLYCKNLDYVNNWDLVDSSAHQIVGGQLHGRSQRLLVRLAKSKVLWERRVAMIATYHDIKAEQFDVALQIAELLVNDEHDLIHKAVGWMLREVGKRDREAEEAFLKQHCQEMPRTMLRYAIEAFPERLRKRYLQGKA